ncbi:hypothetical protein C482_15371 [Natrialba chahannaoensis JCM 10990]|uniref:Uncharacterized protein n=1 Tax=Natrialba chahannaoensis JCM 10990 TaxID=1227492 RepID=M0AFW2_9EURY|nr:hypothetical protein [Natrialba chahannaoensis]ELY96767.1 hypothetical protein C482_15371 [Natrialba chahannaoensis JCM 10990]
MLTDRVVLEIDPISGTDEMGVFVLSTDLETTDELDRSYVLAERGQYVTEAFDIAPNALTDPVSSSDFGRREGYHIDGGAGTDSITVSATRGAEETTQWGDGSADGESTQYDAASGDLDAQVDVLRHWLNETRSDSGGQTRLHIRGHTDGTYSDSAGPFGEPITVAVQGHTISKEDHAEISITLTLVRTATVPNVDDALDDVQDAVDEVVAELGEYTPDW